MIKAILLSVTLIIAASQAAQMTLSVGGYQDYTDLLSQQFQDVLAFIHSSRPELSAFTPTSVQRQLVNGLNYRVQLQSPDECTVRVTVYSTFQKVLTLSDHQPIACPTKLVAPIVAVPISFPISGGYTVQSNPEGETFENALSQALSQNNYRKSDLVLTETQIVSGTNYRFTFRNEDGSLKQVVIYVPLGGRPARKVAEAVKQNPKGSPIIVPHPVPIGGGWREVSDPSSYADVLQAIFKAYPEVKSYTVSGAEKQVVAGFNYRIALQKNSDETIKYDLFSVYVDLQGVPTITHIESISVSGYSVQQIIQTYNSSLQLHSQLSGFTLTAIDNIWQKEGLAFTFNKENKKYRVFIYNNNGQVRNLIY